jgi:nitroimidazol reductase NimA-like FMN-containing flavoprotein (pyridoxamine 5'-phosphate oxidase superfamily)
MLGSLTPTQIDRLLEEQHVARIGCHADGRTYVVPVTYVYHQGAIYAHSAEGLKLRMMRENPEVCIEVDEIHDMSDWRTVIARGRFEQLQGDHARAALAMLVARLLPVLASETASLNDSLGVDEMHLADVRGRKAIPFRIVLSERSGRFERH